MTPFRQVNNYDAPMKPNKRATHVYAIIRIDKFLGEHVPVERKVTVKKILPNAAEAEAEVKRLQALQKDERVVYFFQITRLELKDAVLAPALVTRYSIDTHLAAESRISLERTVAINPQPSCIPAESPAPDPAPKGTVRSYAVTSLPIGLPNWR